MIHTYCRQRKYNRYLKLLLINTLMYTNHLNISGNWKLATPKHVLNAIEHEAFQKSAYRLRILTKVIAEPVLYMPLCGIFHSS